MYACKTDLKNKIKMMISTNVVYTYNEKLAIKRNEILSHATIWMNLENNLLSERARYKRTNIT